MIKGGKGGANTLTGSVFELKVDLASALSNISFIETDGYEVKTNGKVIGYVFKKYDFYKKFLRKYNVDWKLRVSKRLLPDDAYFCLKTKTLIIIEKKFQSGSGSTDEKIQTCDFKKKQYERLVQGLDFKVQYVYLLNDWFKDKKYQDALNYVKKVNCDYYFNKLPKELFNL
jgi:hypothetical protein